MKQKILSFGAFFLLGISLFFAGGEFTIAGPLDIESFESSEIFDPDWRGVVNRDENFIQPFEGNTIENLHILFYENIVPLFKYLFTFVAILLWLLYMSMMITAAGNEETISTQRKNLAWGIMGFLLISLAVSIGEALAPVNNAKDIIQVDETERQIQKVISFLQMSLTIAALGSMFYAGANFIRSQGEEEEISKSKKYIQWGVMGLVIAMLAEPLVRMVFYPVTQEEVDPALSNEQVGNLASEFGGMLKFFLTFLGITAVATLIIAGFYYITSFGNEERQGKARQVIIGTLIGIVLILSSYTLVAFLVPG